MFVLSIEIALPSFMRFNGLLMENLLKHLHVGTFPGRLVTSVKSCLTVRMAIYSHDYLLHYFCPQDPPAYSNASNINLKELHEASKSKFIYYSSYSAFQNIREIYIY